MAAFYREHGRVVFAQILLVAGERALAEEILPDTMLAVWRGAASFRGESWRWLTPDPAGRSLPRTSPSGGRFTAARASWRCPRLAAAHGISPDGTAGQDALRWVGSVSLWRRPVNCWLNWRLETQHRNKLPPGYQ